MKKFKVIVAALLVAAFGVGRVIGGESYTVSGTAPLTLAIPAEGGTLAADSMVYSVVSNSTLTIYRPHLATTASHAASASTTLTVYTASSNTVSGYSPTVGTDYLLVRDTGSNGYQLRLISAAPSYNSTTNATTYTLASAVTCAAGSPVYLVDVPNAISLPVIAAQNGVQLLDVFTSYNRMPVYLSLPGVAGASSISGNYHTED